MGYYTNGKLEFGYYDSYRQKAELSNGKALYGIIAKNKMATYIRDIDNNNFHVKQFIKYPGSEWQVQSEYNTTYVDYAHGEKPDFVTATIPLFNEGDNEAIQKYKDNGDISGAINKDEIQFGKNYFDIYIDGNDRPNITLGCTVEKDLENCPFTSSINIEVF